MRVNQPYKTSFGSFFIVCLLVNPRAKLFILPFIMVTTYTTHHPAVQPVQAQA